MIHLWKEPDKVQQSAFTPQPSSCSTLLTRTTSMKIWSEKVRKFFIFDCSTSVKIWSEKVRKHFHLIPLLLPVICPAAKAGEGSAEKGDWTQLVSAIMITTHNIDHNDYFFLNQEVIIIFWYPPNMRRFEDDIKATCRRQPQAPPRQAGQLWQGTQLSLPLLLLLNHHQPHGNHQNHRHNVEIIKTFSSLFSPCTLSLAFCLNGLAHLAPFTIMMIRMMMMMLIMVRMIKVMTMIMIMIMMMMMRLSQPFSAVVHGIVWHLVERWSAQRISKETILDLSFQNEGILSFQNESSPKLSHCQLFLPSRREVSSRLGRTVAEHLSEKLQL